jgi:hypothetical protein
MACLNLASYRIGSEFMPQGYLRSSLMPISLDTHNKIATQIRKVKKGQAKNQKEIDMAASGI